MNDNSCFCGDTGDTAKKHKEERFMKARVEEGCISCGTCVAVCPEVFRFNDDGLAEAYEAIEPEYESGRGKPETAVRYL